jgi:prepilin-type processing-associated H-X9-DG protein
MANDRLETHGACPGLGLFIPSSKHPGGANVGLVDGRTRFARESISPAHLRALVTIAGDEGVTLDELMSY